MSIQLSRPLSAKAEKELKLRSDKFIENAVKIHGDLFDYSKSNYISAKIKIIITCKISDHGDFEQTPDRHLNSNGCQKCTKIIAGLSRRLTHAQFLQKAADVHGDIYDYSKTKYEKSDVQITIICPIHNEFKQTPNAHLCGRGCNKCAIQLNSNKQRKTFEQFIQEARSKHGDKFDYSEVVYINTNTHITIKCPTHGTFTQTPIDHISSMFGCKKCADINKGLLCRSNTDDFIGKSIIIHGDKYDYSKVEYVTNDLHVIIMCKIHKDFEQLPAVHLRGNGCPLCANKNNGDKLRYTNEEFIEKAKEVHGELYNYDNIDYVTSHTKIIIECPTHGEFVQTPNSHLSGKGCPICANKYTGDISRKTLEQFVKDAQEIHGDKYDYSKVVYINSTTLVTIICPIHQEFEQTPGGHLCGGCKQCAHEYVGRCRRKSQEQFIMEASFAHNNKYKYDKVVYIHSHASIIITCPKHGDFTQKPANHCAGKGCSKCIGQISKISMEWLYMIMINYPKLLLEYHIPNTKFHADGYDSETNTIYEFHGDYWHGNPKIYAPTVYNSITKCTMGDLYQKTLDKKKKCKELGYNYIEIWENHWNHFKKNIRMIQLQFRRKRI